MNNVGLIRRDMICRQINWDSDETLFQAWAKAKTGFPFIDAIMTQLSQGILNSSYSLRKIN